MVPDRIVTPVSVTAARPLDESALSRFTGQTAVGTVEEAKRLRADAEIEAADARLRRRAARWGLMIAVARVAVARIGAPPIVVGVIAGGALAILLAFLGVFIHLPLGFILFFSLGALTVVGGGLAVIAADNPDETDATRYGGRREAFSCARTALDSARARCVAAESELTRTAKLLETIQAAAAHRLKVTESDEIRRLAAFARSALQERLLTVDCRQLSGPEFEKHLWAIFDVLGYTVEHKGRTGDQGVDLVLSTGGDRIAVQAKCYSGPVGNDAVQEAHAGKTFHACQRCAVITSSFFTRSARELAASVDCKLVGGDQLPDLIRGRIRL